MTRRIVLVVLAVLLSADQLFAQLPIETNEAVLRARRIAKAHRRVNSSQNLITGVNQAQGASVHFWDECRDSATVSSLLSGDCETAATKASFDFTKSESNLAVRAPTSGTIDIIHSGAYRDMLSSSLAAPVTVAAVAMHMTEPAVAAGVLDTRAISSTDVANRYLAAADLNTQIANMDEVGRAVVAENLAGCIKLRANATTSGTNRGVNASWVKNDAQCLGERIATLSVGSTLGSGDLALMTPFGTGTNSKHKFRNAVYFGGTTADHALKQGASVTVTDYIFVQPVNSLLGVDALTGNNVRQWKQTFIDTVGDVEFVMGIDPTSASSLNPLTAEIAFRTLETKVLPPTIENFAERYRRTVVDKFWALSEIVNLRCLYENETKRNMMTGGTSAAWRLHVPFGIGGATADVEECSGSLLGTPSTTAPGACRSVGSLYVSKSFWTDGIENNVVSSNYNASEIKNRALVTTTDTLYDQLALVGWSMSDSLGEGLFQLWKSQQRGSGDYSPGAVAAITGGIGLPVDAGGNSIFLPCEKVNYADGTPTPENVHAIFKVSNARRRVNPADRMMWEIAGKITTGEMLFSLLILEHFVKESPESSMIQSVARKLGTKLIERAHNLQMPLEEAIEVNLEQLRGLTQDLYYWVDENTGELGPLLGSGVEKNMTAES